MASSVARTYFQAGAIPTIWEPVFEYRAMQTRGVSELFWDVSDRVQGRGNRYRINILNPLAGPTYVLPSGGPPLGGSGDYFYNVSAAEMETWDFGGTNAGVVRMAAAQTPKYADLYMKLHAFGVTVDPDVNEMAISDMIAAYTPLLVENLWQGMEEQICTWAGLAAVFNQSIGDNLTDFGSANFAAALQMLLSQAGDKLQMGGGEINAVLPLMQLDHIISDPNVVNASVRGTREGVAVTGKMGTLYGVPIHLSQKCYSSTGLHGFVANKKAIAWGRKYNVKIETDRQDLINKVIAYCTWGVRSIHAFDVLGAATGNQLNGQLLTRYVLKPT